MASKTAILSVKILGDAKNLSGEFDKVEKKAGGLSKAFKVAAGAIAAIGIGSFVKDAVLAAEAAATANNRVGQILSQTAGASDAQMQNVLDFAEALSTTIGVSDETIKAGQAILGTFKSVAASAGEAGGVFERATVAAADLAAAGFGSIESNSTALGKALEDPVKGLAALAKSGVTFTEDRAGAHQDPGREQQGGQGAGHHPGAIENRLGVQPRRPPTGRPRSGSPRRTSRSRSGQCCCPSSSRGRGADRDGHPCVPGAHRVRQERVTSRPSPKRSTSTPTRGWSSSCRTLETPSSSSATSSPARPSPRSRSSASPSSCLRCRPSAIS